MFMVALTILINVFSEDRILLVVTMGWLMVIGWFTSVINFFRNFRPDYLITSIVLLLCFCLFLTGLVKKDNENDISHQKMAEVPPKDSENNSKKSNAITKRHELIHFSDNDDLKIVKNKDPDKNDNSIETNLDKKDHKTLHVHYKDLGDELTKLFYGDVGSGNDKSRTFLYITILIAIISVFLLLFDSSFLFWIPTFAPSLYEQNDTQQDPKKISNNMTGICYYLLQNLISLGIISITSEEISSESPLYREIVDFKQRINKQTKDKQSNTNEKNQRLSDFEKIDDYDYYNYSISSNINEGRHHDQDQESKDQKIVEINNRYYDFNVYVFGVLVKNFLVDKTTKHYQPKIIVGFNKNNIPKNSELKNIDPISFSGNVHDDDDDENDHNEHNKRSINVIKTEIDIKVDNYDFENDSLFQNKKSDIETPFDGIVDNDTSEFIKSSINSNNVREDVHIINSIVRKISNNFSEMSNLFIVFKKILDKKRNKMNRDDNDYENTESFNFNLIDNENNIKCFGSWSLYKKFLVATLILLIIMTATSHKDVSVYIPVDISENINWISVGTRSLLSFTLWMGFITMIYFNKINRISSIIHAINKCEMMIYKIICFSIAKEVTNRTYVNILGSKSSSNKIYHGVDSNHKSKLNHIDNTTETIKKNYGNVDNVEFELLNKDSNSKTKKLSNGFMNKDFDNNNQSSSIWLYRTIKRSNENVTNIILDNTDSRKSKRYINRSSKSIIHQMDVKVIVNDSMLKYIYEKIHKRFSSLISKVYNGNFDYFDGIKMSEYILFIPLIIPIYVANTLWNSTLIFLLELFVISGVTLLEIFFWYEMWKKFTKSKTNTISNWMKNDDIKILSDFFNFVSTNKYYQQSLSYRNGVKVIKETKLGKILHRKHKRDERENKKKSENNIVRTKKSETKQLKDNESSFGDNSSSSDDDGTESSDDDDYEDDDDDDKNGYLINKDDRISDSDKSKRVKNSTKSKNNVNVVDEDIFG